ncbi:M15 family peptidase [Lysinibacillus yapensis]|uniref:M15 family peptidase n=1 Tax=Ureibacillus yapensis TaxID=2304605 RepID=A0A396SBF2_9BACL|nr:M15 family metallopeptidase [Lysinibacillus yapensis]RHW38691.1 M15 family peptidase [Lysinibacillus yapensis]
MTSVTTTCRDLSELSTAAEMACRLLFQECFKAGIKDIFITETYRSQERQNYLYAQGRTRPGQKVTWTLESNHKSRRAWDIAVAPPKKLYDESTLNKVGAIAKKLGITWGGAWIKNLDQPHFEVPANWTPPNGYKLEGQVIVPSNSKLKVQLIVEDKTAEVKGVSITKEEDVLEFSSNTTKNALRDELSQYVEKGYITKGWLAKFENGVMTTGDYLALRLIADQRKAKEKEKAK